MDLLPLDGFVGVARFAILRLQLHDLQVREYPVRVLTHFPFQFIIILLQLIQLNLAKLQSLSELLLLCYKDGHLVELKFVIISFLFKSLQLAVEFFNLFVMQQLLLRKFSDLLFERVQVLLSVVSPKLELAREVIPLILDFVEVQL